MVVLIIKYLTILFDIKNQVYGLNGNLGLADWGDSVRMVRVVGHVRRFPDMPFIDSGLLKML